MEGIRKAKNERNLSEGQWEDRKQRSLGVGQRRKALRNRYMDGRHEYVHQCSLTARFLATCSPRDELSHSIKRTTKSGGIFWGGRYDMHAR